MSRQLYLLFFVTLYLVTAGWLLHDYITLFSLKTMLGLMTLYYGFELRKGQTGNTRYGWLALALALLACFLPVKTVLYAAFVCAVFFVVESFAGALSALPFITMILLSPLFEYVVNVFSFPVRLELTQWVCKLLSLTGAEATAEGNTIWFQQAEFSVDPACMGLHMLSVSFLTGLLLTAIFQQRYQKQLPVIALLAALPLLFVLNIFCNLFRMVCLVYFKLMPESPMHDIAGLFCFGVYVLAPACGLMSWLVRRYGYKSDRGIRLMPAAKSVSMLWRNGALAIIILFCVLAYSFQSGSRLKPAKVAIRKGFETEQLPDKVTRLKNKEVLIYLKEIAGCYAAEHHPMICWKGSGYEFKKVRVIRAAGHPVYIAELHHQKDLLYTAWWYTNGVEAATISQLEWRWNMLKGAKPYTLVNITAETPAALNAWLDFSL